MSHLLRSCKSLDSGWKYGLSGCKPNWPRHKSRVCPPKLRLCRPQQRLMKRYLPNHGTPVPAAPPLDPVPQPIAAPDGSPSVGQGPPQHWLERVARDGAPAHWQAYIQNATTSNLQDPSEPSASTVEADGTSKAVPGPLLAHEDLVIPSNPTDTALNSRHG